jgi:hypothetical protein
VDQATIAGYGVGYIVAISVIFLMFLPWLIAFVLLLLSAGAVQLVVLLLKAMTLGAFRGVGRMFRSSADGLPRGRGGDGVVPH